MPKLHLMECGYHFSRWFRARAVMLDNLSRLKWFVAAL
jgi:hypothetical protein